MKRFYLAFIFILSINTAALAEVKIAYIDIEQILKNSKAANDASEQIQAKLAEYQAAISAEGKELETKRAELEKQAAILTKEALVEKQKQLFSKVAAFEKKIAAQRKALEGSYVKAIAEIEKAVYAIITEQAEKSNYNLILDKDNIIYFKDLDNLTQIVTEVLNQKTPKVKVEF